MARLGGFWADARQPAFLFPFLLFGVLLFACPNCRPVCGEEIVAVVMTRGGLGQVLGAAAGDVYPPFFFVLLKAVRALAGERVGALRLFCSLLALASFPLFWAVARRFFGRSVAVAAWLLATSSFVVFASRFLQYYSLAMLETAAATYLFLLLLEHPTRRLWIAYGAVWALSIYTFYLTVLVIVAHAIVFFAAWRDEPRRFIAPLAVYVLVGVAFLPWVGVMGQQIGRVAAAQSELGIGQRTTAAAVQLAYTAYAFAASDSISPFALPFSAAAAVFYFVLLVLGIRRVWEAPTARRHLLLAMLGLGLAAPAVLRLAGWPVAPIAWAPVHLVFVAPFFLLIVACGLIAIDTRWIRRAAFATVLGVQAFSLVNYFGMRQWTNWACVVPMDEIVAYVQENAQPDDLVILDEWNLGGGPSFYWKGEAGAWRFGPTATRWPARLQSAPRVWVVRAVRDRSPNGQVDRLLDFIKLNFVLDLQGSRQFVKDRPAIYEQKRRWLRQKVYPHEVEAQLFVRPPARL